MRDDWVPENVEQLARHLKRRRGLRERLKASSGSLTRVRRPLSSDEREAILRKTAGRCHVCGGQIDGPWQADHVLAHSGGGTDSSENYLPAHRTCNNYRWDYLGDELQEILRMGVWLRTQIEKQTPIGRLAGTSYIAREKRRVSRRK